MNPRLVTLSEPLNVLLDGKSIVRISVYDRSSIHSLHTDHPIYHQARWDAAKNLVLDPLPSKLGANIKFFHESPPAEAVAGGDYYGVPGLKILLEAIKTSSILEPNPGYHLAVIRKGVLGEVSKIREEVEELEDAVSQGSRIMILHELSDLVGAVEAYLAKSFPGFSMEDLIRMKDITKRAFESGRRK